MMNILLIDDDINLGKVISHQLTQNGFIVTTAIDGQGAIKSFNSDDFEIIISDIQLPDTTGIKILQQIRKRNQDVIFIIITAYGSIENAVKACQLGADDYLTKPFSLEQLLFTVEKAIELRQLRAENRQLKSDLNQKFQFENLVANSTAMQNVFKMALQVARSDASVLISGESGTGKELISRAIHFNSERKDKPLVIVNCPSIPENLLESELFGHRKGSFTGALEDRKGKFEVADGGTIFLDEIGDLRVDLQAKLLRALQEHEIERIGDSEPIKVDIRVIAASNQNLQKLIDEHKFREDLFYRLSVVPILIPPLRDRPDDIPYLIEHFVEKYSSRGEFVIEDGVIEILQSYQWPGNVRELENIIHRLVTLSVNAQIGKKDLPDHIVNHLSNSNGIVLQIPPEGVALSSIEKNVILEVLNRTNGNQTEAAKLLQIPRHVLIYRMKKYEID